MPAGLAPSLGLQVGDEMRFPLGGTRTAALRVVGIAERTIPVRNGEAILVGWGDATGRPSG